MKNKLTRLLLGIAICSSPLLRAGNTYEIKIKVKELKDSTCNLANYYGDKQYIVDTAKADKNGVLLFDGKKKLDPGMYMVVMNKKKLFDLLVMENEQHFSLETDTADYNGHMKVTGSPENKLFFEYLNWLNQKQKQAEKCRTRYKVVKETDKDSAKVIENTLQGLDKEVKAYMADFMQKHPANFTSKFLKATLEVEIPEIPKLANGRKDSTFAYRFAKAHYFDNIDMSDERLLRTPIYFPKMKQYLENMTTPVPDSINKEGDLIISKAKGNKETFKFCVYYMISNYEASKVMGFDAIFVHEAFMYYRTGQAYWSDKDQVKKIVQRAEQLDSILIGKIAPELIMQDSLVGLTNDFNTYALRSTKAKYTIVYFWDPDCGHCQKETPKLRDFYNSNKAKYGLEVYAIGCVSELGPWRKYIREKELHWINVVDAFNKNHYKHKYDIYSTPVIYILDEHKKIIAKRLETEQIGDFLDRFGKMKK
ncbi:MAG TPA: thioredoxin-like domain-containing protein [Bacteroidia bacterium]|nr:thioredoxin-like domain-containing protein [Bacteroidia bacterium]